jgi:hypothetical protein
MARIRLDRLIEFWDPRLKDAFLQAIRNVGASRIDGRSNQARGDVEGLRAVTSISCSRTAFRRFIEKRRQCLLRVFRLQGTQTLPVDARPDLRLVAELFRPVITWSR